MHTDLMGYDIEILSPPLYDRAIVDEDEDEDDCLDEKPIMHYYMTFNHRDILKQYDCDPRSFNGMTVDEIIPKLHKSIQMMAIPSQSIDDVVYRKYSSDLMYIAQPGIVKSILQEIVKSLVELSSDGYGYYLWLSD